MLLFLQLLAGQQQIDEVRTTIVYFDFKLFAITHACVGGLCSSDMCDVLHCMYT